MSNKAEYLPEELTQKNNGSGHKPVFRLAPVEDDLTFSILRARQEVCEDADLKPGPKLLFVYVLDLSLKRTVNVRPGVVTIAQTKLAEKLGVSQRTIFAWKRALVAKRYVWMTHQPMPNTWPLDSYHISALHPQDAWQEKTTAEGMWGNGERRQALPTPGAGARRPGQRSLGLSGSTLPRRAGEHKTEQNPDFAAQSGSELPPSVEAGCDSESQRIATESRNGLRRRVEADCDGESKRIATHGRSGLRPTVEADCEHIEVEVPGKSQTEGGTGQNSPPSAAHQEEKNKMERELAAWSQTLEGLFPSRLEKLKAELRRKLAQAVSAPLRDLLKRKVAIVTERLEGPTLPDEPKPAPKPKPAEPEKELTPAELREAAEYLVSIKKEHMLTPAMRKALESASPKRVSFPPQGRKERKGVSP